MYTGVKDINVVKVYLSDKVSYDYVGEKMFGEVVLVGGQFKVKSDHVFSGDSFRRGGNEFYSINGMDKLEVIYG